MKSLMMALCASMCVGSALAADLQAPPCDKPILPNRLAAPSTVERFKKKESLYEKCVSHFVDEQRAIATSSTDPAVVKRAVDSADAAMLDFNAFVKEVVAAAGDDDPSTPRGLVNKPISSIPPEPAGAPRR